MPSAPYFAVDVSPFAGKTPEFKFEFRSSGFAGFPGSISYPANRWLRCTSSTISISARLAPRFLSHPPMHCLASGGNANGRQRENVSPKPKQGRTTPLNSAALPAGAFYDDIGFTALPTGVTFF